MSYDISNIISLQTFITPSGLGLANFATATVFAPEGELPVGFDPDTYRVYNTVEDLAADFGSTTETYLAGSKWLGGIPATREIYVWGVEGDDADWTTTLNKARNVFWWYWTIVDADTYAVPADVTEIATWNEAVGSFFINCQTGAAAAAIRDPNDDTDIASALTTAGQRHVRTFTHATDPYAGIAEAKWLAAVNYSADNSTITTEFKKLSNTPAENLTATETSAMTQDTKKAGWYGTVELKGSTDQGRVFNSFTHSSYGEYYDDVVNLDAFANALTVALYNALAGSATKIPQTPKGQNVLLATARRVCEQYVSNGYLGPRNYIDPDDGVEKFTEGYEILTKPEDILDLSDADRNARKSAPIIIRVFRAGAVHAVDVSVYVY